MFVFFLHCMLKYSTFVAFNLLTFKSCARHGFRDETMKILKIAASFAVATFAVCANAQNLSKVFFEKSYFNFIPSTLTSDGSDQLSTRRMSYEIPKAISLYDVNMKPIKTISTSNNIGIIPFYYTDNQQTECVVFATQSLFDKDNSYEYIVPIGSYDEKYNVAEATGLRIVKDDNTTIAEISFDDKWILYMGDWGRNFDNWDIKVFRLFDDTKLKEHFYLAVEVYRDRGEYEENATLVYAFERGKVSTSIKKVNEIKNSIKAIPSMPQKNEVVKIDLSGIQSPKKLLVVNSEGKIVCSKNLSSDQKESTVETGGFPAGMYIIQVADAKNIRENCRIIIR